MDGTMTATKATPTVRPRLSAGTCPPGIVDAYVGSLFEMYGLFVRSATDYYGGLLARTATPLDVAADVAAWTATVVGRTPSARLRSRRVDAGPGLENLHDRPTRGVEGIKIFRLEIEQDGTAVEHGCGNRAAQGLNRRNDRRIYTVQRWSPIRISSVREFRLALLGQPRNGRPKAQTVRAGSRAG